MNIGLVHDYLNQNGGAEKVLDEFHNLFKEAPIYTLIEDENVSKKFEADIHSSFIQKIPFSRKHYKKMLPLFPVAIENFRLEEYDVVLSSSSAFAKGIITKPNTTHICYCHTPMRYVWDLYHAYLYDDGPRGLYRKVLPLILHYIRIWDRISADRVDYFIANSYNVKRRIEKYYQRDAVVIHPPVEVSRFSISNSIDDYFLIVSRLIPYKRIDIVIEAFNELGYPLIVIGDGYDLQRLKNMANSNIIFLGYQSDEVIAEYYQKCKAFIFPGEEDFGITPLEAQASGRPVIAYRKGGALETVIDQETGLFFNKQDKDYLKSAVELFYTKDFDPLHIREHAIKFDSSIFKEKISGYVNSIYEKG